MFKVCVQRNYITIPTMVTLIRIILTPFIMYSIMQHNWCSATMLFITAAMTDFIDGFLARFLKSSSFIGACLDPVADKVLIIGTLYALTYAPCCVPFIPTWFLWAVITKECIQLMGACLLFTYGYTKIEPTMLSKCTTTITFLFLLFTLLMSYFELVPPFFYGMLLVLMSSMIIVFLQYSIFALKVMRERKQHDK